MGWGWKSPETTQGCSMWVLPEGFADSLKANQPIPTRRTLALLSLKLASPRLNARWWGCFSITPGDVRSGSEPCEPNGLFTICLTWLVTLSVNCYAAC